MVWCVEVGVDWWVVEDDSLSIYPFSVAQRVSVLAVWVDDRLRVESFLVESLVSLYVGNFIECRTLPKVGNLSCLWRSIVNLYSEMLPFSSLVVGEVLLFLIMIGWWSEDLVRVCVVWQYTVLWVPKFPLLLCVQMCCLIFSPRFLCIFFFSSFCLCWGPHSRWWKCQDGLDIGLGGTKVVV